LDPVVKTSLPLRVPDELYQDEPFCENEIVAVVPAGFAERL